MPPISGSAHLLPSLGQGIEKFLLVRGTCWQAFRIPCLCPRVYEYEEDRMSLDFEEMVAEE